MSWRKSAHIVIGATLWAVSLCAAADIDGVRYLSDIKQLTSKKMKGRGSGSPELDRAAHFIAKEFRRAGLRTLLRRQLPSAVSCIRQGHDRRG